MELVPKAVTLQIIWRRTLHAIWRTLRVWTNWRGSRKRPESSPLIGFRLLQPHLEDDRPLKAVAAAAGIPFRTAQRWVSLYRQFGLTALARKRRTDTGQHREMSAKLKEAIEGIALQKPPIPVAAICRQVQAAGTRFGRGAAELLARVPHRRRAARRSGHTRS